MKGAKKDFLGPTQLPDNSASSQDNRPDPNLNPNQSKERLENYAAQVTDEQDQFKVQRLIKDMDAEKKMDNSKQMLSHLHLDQGIRVGINKPSSRDDIQRNLEIVQQKLDNEKVNEAKGIYEKYSLSKKHELARWQAMAKHDFEKSRDKDKSPDR